MKRLLIPLLIAAALPLTAQEQPEKLKGLLWEVSGNGIAKKGYLYGTMHVPEKMAFNLSDSFFVALRSVDVVALETDHDRWQEFSQILDGREDEIFDPGYGEDGPAQPNLYHGQFDFSPPGNQLLGAVLSAKPRMTNEFLYRTNQYRQDYEEDTYLDMFIFQAGRKLGKAVIGLETLEGSFEALIRAQLPDEDEEEDERSYYPEAFSRTTIEDAYRDQDLSLLDSINKAAQPGKNFRRWMLDERNYIMANGMDSILQSGSALFAAVGAAHLPGETGLIPLLRQKGYTLRPVQFSARTSKRDMEAIESMRFAAPFSRQWAADSSWSAEAPGKFFKTVDGMGLEQFLSADMNNGAYYAVYRLRTYGLWNGQSPEYIAERIDSLIYEKIPGKIQERKRLAGAPFPGHEITTRTRRGDIVRFKILVLPMETYVFATGGNGDYAAGEEAERFLSSVQFRQTNTVNKPTTVQPEHGGFRVTFPVVPVFSTTSDQKNSRFAVAASDPVDSALYMVFRGIYHDWDYIEEDTFELNIIGEKIAEQFTKTIPQGVLVSPAPYPTQDMVFRSDRDSAWYFLRLVINGPHYYLLGCRKSTPNAPKAFFESFAIEPHRYPQGWEMLRDTGMHFEVMAPPAPEIPGQAFLQNLKNIVLEGMKKSKRGDQYDFPRQMRRTRTLRAPEQGEAVFVQSMELPTGGLAPSLDSFQTFIRRRETDDGKLTVREQHWDMRSDRLLVGDLLLEDTNSVRGIRSRIFLTPGQLYIVSATVQLDAPPSAFVQKVLETFTPTDTTAGVIPFGGRNLDFLKNLYAEDSLARDKALGQLAMHWSWILEPSDFAAVRGALVHPKFGQLRYKHRKVLLGALGDFSSPDALNLALQLWQQYSDSARYRQTLLIAMAGMKTRPAHDALMRLLKQKNVFSTESTFSDIVEAFKDSLELSVRLIPDLIDLAEVQPAYHKYVRTMLAPALAKGLLKTGVFARLKPTLIADSYQQIGNKQLARENRQDASDMYGYSDDASLAPNLRLLAFFLPKDNDVRALFEQATRCPDKSVQVLARCLMRKHGLPVEQDTLRGYAADDKTRYMLYTCLAETDQLSSFSTWFSDTTALVRSMLFEELRDEQSENGLDSTRFLSAHRTVRGGNPVHTYFFDVKKKKDKEWRLAYVVFPLASRIFGIPDRNEDNWNNNGYQLRPEIRILYDLTEQERAEYIEKRIGAERFEGRARYERWSGGDGQMFYNGEE